MPRYFFHVRDGIDSPDLEGTELADLGSARAEALVYAGEIIRNAGMRAELGEEWRITVTDEAGLMLFVMTFLVAESPAAAQRRPAVLAD